MRLRCGGVKKEGKDRARVDGLVLARNRRREGMNEVPRYTVAIRYCALDKGSGVLTAQYKYLDVQGG